MGKNRNLIIAIDGPAGSGKSTVCRLLAEELKYLYVDTGAMYRALTWKAIDENLDLTDGESLAELARRTSVKLEKDKKVFVDGIDVTEKIRNPEITKNVSHIANVPEVRERMVTLQREAGRTGGAVLEGRDIGTIVFPDADIKIYLDAELEERARRRYKELKEKGYQVEIDKVVKDLAARDETDRGRKIAPLRVAEDATVIDTTHMNINQVVEKLLDILEDKNKFEDK